MAISVAQATEAPTEPEGKTHDRPQAHDSEPPDKCEKHAIRIHMVNRTGWFFRAIMPAPTNEPKGFTFSET